MFADALIKGIDLRNMRKSEDTENYDWNKPRCRSKIGAGDIPTNVGCLLNAMLCVSECITNVDY